MNAKVRDPCGLLSPVVLDVLQGRLLVILSPSSLPMKRIGNRILLREAWKTRT